MQIHWTWIRNRLADVLSFAVWFGLFVYFVPALYRLPFADRMMIFELSLPWWCLWFMAKALISAIRRPDRYAAEELETIFAEAQQGRVMVPANDGGYRIYTLHVPTGEWESRWVADWEDVVNEQTNLSTQASVGADR